MNALHGLAFPSLRHAFVAWAERHTRATLLRADELPPKFAIASTYGGRAIGKAERVGEHVRVTIMGESVVLAPDQRVQIVEVVP